MDDVTTPSRLQPRDDLGVRADRILGFPSVVMMGMYFEKAIDPATVAETFHFLQQGPMSRLVKRVRIPGARNRWVQKPEAGEMSCSTTPVPIAGIRDWLEEQGRAPLDLFEGPVWRLVTTAVEGGGTVIGLLCHHAVADGHGLLNALTAAAEGKVVGGLADDGGLAADLMDGLRQWRAAGTSAMRLFWSRLREKSRAQGELAAEARLVVTAADLDEGAASSKRFVPHRAYLDFSNEDFRRAAAERGGTVNSLFVAISARLLVATGVIAEGSTVAVSQRVSDRAEGDYRGNVVAGVEILIDVAPSLYQDVRPIREANKEALSKRTPGQEDIAELDSPLIQAMPDWLLAWRFGGPPKNPCRTLCTVSNVGTAADAVVTIDGQRARTMYPSFLLPKHTEANLWRRHSSAIQVILVDIGEVVSIMVEGRNPELHSVGHDEFVAVLVHEFRRWGLEPVRTL